jgi:hypothetical protein
MSRTNAARSQFNSLGQRVETLVPGFEGYVSPTERRNDDGRLRVEVCERIDRVAARLEDFLLDLAEEGWSPGLRGLDGFVRSLEELRERVTQAPDEYGRFLDHGDLGSDQLNHVLECDLALLVELDAADEDIHDLELPSFSPGHLRDTMAGIEAHVRAVDAAFERRHRLIKEF